jgi:transposase
VLDGWQESGATKAMRDELRRQCRIAAGRMPEPSAAIIDSQSVKAAETVRKGGRGFDAGKKINGRKRHIAVDTIGLLLTVLITRRRARPRRGKAAAVEPAPRLPLGQGHLGRRQLRRQAGHLGQEGPQAHPPDRQAPR